MVGDVKSVEVRSITTTKYNRGGEESGTAIVGELMGDWWYSWVPYGTLLGIENIHCMYIPLPRKLASFN